jgi:hypothetical protein
MPSPARELNAPLLRSLPDHGSVILATTETYSKVPAPK